MSDSFLLLVLRIPSYQPSLSPTFLQRLSLVFVLKSRTPHVLRMGRAVEMTQVMIAGEIRIVACRSLHRHQVDLVRWRRSS